MHSLSARGRSGRLIDLLLARGSVSEAQLLEAAARHYGAALIDPCAPMPDPWLIDRIGMQDCLRMGLVPLRQVGAATIVATLASRGFRPLAPPAGG